MGLIYAEHHPDAPHYADAPFGSNLCISFCNTETFLSCDQTALLNFFSLRASIVWPISNSPYSERAVHLSHVVLHDQETGVSDMMEL